MEREPVKIFYCYAREDEALRDHLDKHLAPLRREGLITSWYDREISAGKDYAQEILQRLDSADIFLALISPAFMSSTYCYGIEVSKALDREGLGDLRVIPVILRPVDWKHTLLGKFQALPRDGKPVTEWKTRDKGLQDIARSIRKVVGEIQETEPAYDATHYMELGNFWLDVLLDVRYNEGSSIYWTLENIEDERLEGLILKEGYQAFKLAARLDPENLEAWKRLFEFSDKLGKHEVALFACDKLLQNLKANDNQYWDFYEMKISHLEQLGQHKEAQEMKIQFNQYIRATYAPTDIFFRLLE